MKHTKEKVEEAAYALKKVIKPGDTIYGIWRTRNAISIVVFSGGSDLHPSYGISVVTGLRLVQTAGGYNAIRMNGYGYNKLDAIGEALSFALFGDGKSIKTRML